MYPVSLKFLLIVTPQLPSPSVNPAMYQGLSGAMLEAICGLWAFIFIFNFLFISVPLNRGFTSENITLFISEGHM